MSGGDGQLVYRGWWGPELEYQRNDLVAWDRTMWRARMPVPRFGLPPDEDFDLQSGERTWEPLPPVDLLGR